ncbi:MAG TPA: HupE/UreJ family protein, partial [bacterium]|nr:HupE/UreJ family protein [bacterium]
MTLRVLVKKNVSIIAFLLLLSLSAWAHDPGLSSTIGTLSGNQLELTLSLAIRDAGQIVPLDADNNGTVTANEFNSARAALVASLTEQCKVEFDGALAKPDTVVCQQDDAKNISVRLTFLVPPSKELVLDFKFIQAMPLGHRMFLSLSDAAGKIVMEQLLTASTSTVAVPLNSETAAPAKAAHTFADFVLMGIEHIGTGYDHLLFLFALLVVTRSFRS